MVPSRSVSILACALAALGCSKLTGLSDLEKVDCVKNCGDGGGADGGGTLVKGPAIGPHGSCAIMQDDTLWCWGANPGVEPGSVATKPVRVDTLGGVAQVGIGVDHSCALDASGQVWCWGRNDAGQLGDGTTNSSAVPKVVPNLPVIDTFTTGAAHTCAVTSADNPPVQTFCWGNNSHGQLGDGTIDNALSPRLISFADSAVPIRIGAGDAYTCAVVDVAGVLEMRCWGRNDKGQCGLEPVANPTVSLPTKVPGLPSVERVYSGFQHVCTRTSGTRLVWCWGANLDGQVGIGSASDWAPPSRVIGAAQPEIDTLTAGFRHTCMLVLDTLAVVCWGANDLGQFHGQAGADALEPVLVPELNGAAFMMRQAEHGCGIMPDGSFRCWGANDSGQIGNGNVGEPYSPMVEVSFAP